MALAFTAFTPSAGQEYNDGVTPLFRLFDKFGYNCSKVSAISQIDDKPYDSNGCSLGCKNATFNIGGIYSFDPSYAPTSSSKTKTVTKISFWEDSGCNGEPFNEFLLGDFSYLDYRHPTCVDTKLGVAGGWQKSSYNAVRSDCPTQ